MPLVVYHSVTSNTSDGGGVHDEQPEYIDMLASIHRVLLVDWWEPFEQTRRPFWNSFCQRYIAVPGVGLGWLVPDRQHHRFLEACFGNDASDLSSWRESSRSETLLVIGTPGSGAKHLACWTLITLLPKSRVDKMDMLVLSYNFDGQNMIQNTERSMLGSLIQQILILRPDSCGHIKTHLDRISESKMSYLPSALLWELLGNLLHTVGAHQIFLIIHAVDQCLEAKLYAPSDGSRRTVAQMLANLPSASQKQIKILMTTSSSVDLAPETFTRHFDLSNDGCKDIVRNMAKERVLAIISQTPAWKGFTEEILEKICEEECTHLQTMLNLSSLERSRIPSTKEAIQFWLSKPLPFNTLPWHFELRNISAASDILSWVSFAIRPLTVRELSVAVALLGFSLDGFKSGSVSLNSLEAKISSNLKRDIEDAVKILIKIDDNHDVTLVHHTLRQSLELQGDLIRPDQHGLFARLCLHYIKLCFQHLPQDSTSPSARTHFPDTTALLEYSQQYWTHHYALAQPPFEDLDQQVLDILTEGSQSAALKTWAESYQAKSVNTGLELAIIDDPLLLAVHFGFGRMVRMILKKNEVQQQPERLQKALILSAQCLSSQSEIMEDIISHMPPETPGHDFSSALRTSAAYGNTECLKLLLDHMGDSWDAFLQSVQGEQGQDPLLLAASGGHTSSVELLLNRGCSVLKEDEDGNTAVHLAAQLGHAETLSVMKVLQNDDFKKAQELKSEPLGPTPLGVACGIGSLPTMDLLLKDCDPGDGSPVSELSNKQILMDTVSTGNLAVFKRLSISVKDPFTQLYELCQGDLLGRIASTDIIKFFVSEEAKSFRGGAENPDQVELKEKFDGIITHCRSFACAFMNFDLAIWLSEILDKSPWDEQIRLAVLYGSLDWVKLLLRDEKRVKGILCTGEGVARWVGLMNTVVRYDYVDVLRYLAKKMETALRSASQYLEPQKTEIALMFSLAARRGHTFCLRELFRELFIPFNLSGVWGFVLETVVERCTLGSLHDVFHWKPKDYEPSISQGDATLRHALSIKDDKGRLERVRLLLQNGILEAILYKTGYMSPIYVAVQEAPHDSNVVEMLLKKGARPNLDQELSQTPLHIAVEKDEIDTFRLLLQHGGNPNILDGEGQNVLHLAIKRGRAGMVGLLLELSHQGQNSEEPPNNAPIRRRNTGKRQCFGNPVPDLPIARKVERLDVDAKTKCHPHKTPLILAVEENLTDIVQMLLRAGAKINQEDSDGCTPLTYAIRTGSSEVVEMLIGCGADVNFAGKTDHSFGSPLHFLLRSRPAEKHFEETVKFLLQKGANLNAQDSDKFTPLMRYLCEHHSFAPLPQAPSILMDRLMKETTPSITNSLGKTALHYAAAFYPKTAEVLSGLLEAGANPLARDHLGHTPLYYILFLDEEQSKLSEPVRALISAISSEERIQALSEAFIAAVKTGLKERLDMILDMILDENKKSSNLLFDLPDKSGYHALDIAHSFGEGFESAAQKIIGLGGISAPDEQKKSPTQWNKHDRSEYLHVSKKGLEVSSKAYPNGSILQRLVGTVRGDHPIPMHRRRFYFEVEILELPVFGGFYWHDNAVAIGFETEECGLRGCVGWERNSWGYHSDDAPTPYGEGEVIGVFVEPLSQRARIRKNDEWTGDWFGGVVGQLYPAASFYALSDYTLRLKVNFGKGRGGKSDAFKYPPKEQDWEDTTPEAEEQGKAEKVEEGEETKEQDTEEKEGAEDRYFAESGEEEEHSAEEETGSEEE